jgi:hypothetical protein
VIRGLPIDRAVRGGRSKLSLQKHLADVKGTAEITLGNLSVHENESNCRSAAISVSMISSASTISTDAVSCPVHQPRPTLTRSADVLLTMVGPSKKPTTHESQKK